VGLGFLSARGAGAAGRASASRNRIDADGVAIIHILDQIVVHTDGELLNHGIGEPLAGKYCGLDRAPECIEASHFIKKREAPVATSAGLSNVIIAEHDRGLHIRGRGSIDIHPVDTCNGKPLFPVLVVGFV